MTAERSDRNMADVWEAIAAARPGQPALEQGDVVVDWKSFDAQADALAELLAGRGHAPGDRFAVLLYNAPEFLVSLFAAWKVDLVPVNTNYRYREGEVLHVWRDAGVRAVVFHSSLLPLVHGVREQMPEVRTWLFVRDDDSPCPAWAIDFAEVGSTPSSPGSRRSSRGGDGRYLLYTGGTTGLPKGVQWRLGDLFDIINVRSPIPLPADAATTEVVDFLPSVSPRLLVASPLMHGAGAVRAFAALCQGGTVLLSPQRSFAPVAVLQLIESAQIDQLALVGDGGAMPLLELLDAEPAAYDIRSLRVVTSAGARLSERVARGLLLHNRRLRIVDTFGASEALGLGAAIFSCDEDDTRGEFVPSEDTRVRRDDDSGWVTVGEDAVGLVARRGAIPLGYLGDADRSSQVFREIDGERWALPGDFVRMLPTGRLEILGRGSACINTAGEKVFPDEVEKVIVELPEVQDVAIVGVPDQRFGETVVAVVVPMPGARVDAERVASHVKTKIASYKAPRHVLVVDDLERLATAKIDHRKWRERAAAILGTETAAG